MSLEQNASVTTALPDWRTHPRYYPFSFYLRKRFPCRVHKVTIDAGFTCPNRDGAKGIGGCTYCINESFSPNARSRRRSVRSQVEAGIDILGTRYGAQKFIAYFQAYSNTYAPAEDLKRLYDQALAVPDVVGLSVGTRPDCVPDEVLDMIADYLPSLPEVWIEYGLQSMHDQTLRRVNRGHDFEDFRDAVFRTHRRGIRICVHVILGLPGETPDMMMETADALAVLPIQGIKLHHLYVAKGAPLVDSFRRGEFRTLDAHQYADLAARFLERIPADVTVQRLVGDVAGDLLLAPKWPYPKQQVLDMVTAAFVERDSWQGKRVG